MMKTSPNQREVLITRDMPTKANHKPYLAIYSENIEEAARTLTPVAFKLYLYLASNQDGYNGAFSTAHFSEKFGCDVKSAKTAFTTLVNNGYLTQSPNQKNLFIFNEKPQTPEPAILLPTGLLETKRFETANGEILTLTLNELINKLGDKEQAEEIWRNA